VETIFTDGCSERGISYGVPAISCIPSLPFFVNHFGIEGSSDAAYAQIHIGYDELRVSFEFLGVKGLRASSEICMVLVPVQVRVVHASTVCSGAGLAA
jgi:hypothetical protein